LEEEAVVENEGLMPEAAAPAKKSRNPMRKLYNWVLHWSKTPYGSVALFLLAFAESSFFPIPPDVLLIAMVVAVRKKAWRFASICLVGSVLGGIAGYGIGWGLWESMGAPTDAFSAEHGITGGAILFNYIHGFTPQMFAKVSGLYHEYASLTVFAAAFSPIPYKVITITAGVCKINFFAFLGVSIIGRGARFFIVAFLLKKYGAPMRDFIEKYFNILSILFLILLIAGFAVLKLVT
jgi:membrane protein YqaA with SNARE-associated domain